MGIMRDIIEKQQAVTLKEVTHTSDASMKSKLLEEYGDVSASDEEDSSDDECGPTIAANVNTANVEAKEKAQREKQKKLTDEKKALDKVNRENQNKKKEERQEKEKKRTQKGEKMSGR